MPFPVLEGQSIGIIPPGIDAEGRPHHARQYSIASPRNGERPGYNNLSLTVKRVLEDHQGSRCAASASNYLCDLKVGDKVQVIGPFGASFLMPNHPRSHIVMICTGTGSAPMRAMTEWRRRLRQRQVRGRQADAVLRRPHPGRTALLRPAAEAAQGFHRHQFRLLAHVPGEPKRYVQDLMRERAADLAPLLADPNAYFYVCGLKAMEEGVVLALRDIAQQAGLNWDSIGAALKREGRLHLETY
jgi:benzoyl-CoA 2,3-dioxygenase component A